MATGGLNLSTQAPLTTPGLCWLPPLRLMGADYGLMGASCWSRLWGPTNENPQLSSQELRAQVWKGVWDGCSPCGFAASLSASPLRSLQ